MFVVCGCHWVVCLLLWVCGGGEFGGGVVAFPVYFVFVLVGFVVFLHSG